MFDEAGAAASSIAVAAGATERHTFVAPGVYTFEISSIESFTGTVEIRRP